MRRDLLALTVDDLIILSNRGMVKRAQKELGKFTFTLSEEGDGTVTVRWSDGAECVLPAGKTVGEGQCNCAATTICRHLIRSVLAYQQTDAGSQARPSLLGPASDRASQPWDPGQITDEMLAEHFGRATLTRMRKLFEEGHVVELVRSSKPTAFIHTLSITLRFLVPGDVRYTHCDCEGQAPCRHVPLAVWAFRLLEADKPGGIVSTRKMMWPVPDQLLDDIGRSLQDFAGAGLAGVSQALMDRFRRLEARCRVEGLVWPAEIIAEIVQEHERYASHDARFSPTRVAELMGELCVRSDAIRSNVDTVPQRFIRGTEKDRETRVGTARLVGLGCGVQVHRGGVTLSAYLQEADSGAVVAVCRDFADPPPGAPDPPSPFWRLAQRSVIQGRGQRTSLASLGTKQLLIKGGRRAANYQFMPGRARATANPQAFVWEVLRAPTLAEDFTEIRARLSAQPPTCLRPRRVAALSGALFYVCPVAGVEAARFSVVDQQVQAIVRDITGEQALLIHPYTSRGREGTEALLATLTARPEALCFVAGRVRLGGGGLIIEPVSLLFQEGQSRTMLQPWVARWDGQETGFFPENLVSTTRASDPVLYYPGQVMDALGELFLIGLQRADAQTTRFWQELYRQGAALGFVRFLNPMGQLVDSLSQKSDTLHWDWRPAAQAAFGMSLLARLAQEELPPD